MMNYELQKNEGRWVPLTADGSYVSLSVRIWERMTDQVIVNEVDSTHGKQLLRHFNRGGGFDGWTPSFFLERIDVPAE